MHKAREARRPGTDHTPDQAQAQQRGVQFHYTANTPYVNTIAVERQPVFPGSREIERRIKSIIRWNAMAMVVQANRISTELGGHISSFASSATLLDVGFNHFFRARDKDHDGDMVFFQGHSAPGIYARAFLEGRLTQEHLDRFRMESSGGGLSSYPHPRLMPDFWEYPTVSMGLGPMNAIYHARFLKYLQNRGIADTSQARVWCFMGDGESDEPESLGALSLASREGLDNLVFVVNCNLQRLDGPVRGNGKIIQELEGVFRGATINTPSMLCVADYLDALAWIREIGGVPAAIARSTESLRIISDFVARHEWIGFLAANEAERSSTSVCLSVDLPGDRVKAMVALLDAEGVAHDIGAYRDAPSGLRIWCGATVEPADVARLMPWLKWAYESVKTE